MIVEILKCNSCGKYTADINDICISDCCGNNFHRLRKLKVNDKRIDINFFQNRIKQLEKEKLQAIEIIEKIYDQRGDSEPLRKLLKLALKALEGK